MVRIAVALRSPARFSLLALLAPVIHPLPAESAAVNVSAGAGSAFVAGQGGGVLTHGQTFQIDVLATRSSGNQWILQGSYERYGREAAIVTTIDSYDNGRLYTPIVVAGARSNALTMAAVELGLHRGRLEGVVRPHFEALAGASRTEQSPGPASSFRNDRRPDPGLAVASRTSDWAPALTLGAGLQILAPGRIGLTASAAARWSPARDLVGPLVPMRLGATWPVAPDAEPEVERPSRHTPRLRLSAGASALRDPARLRGETGPSLALAVETTVPVSRGLALSLEGEEVVRRKEVRGVIRQEVDDSGNLVDVYGKVPLSFTATAVTAGVRASKRFSRLGLDFRVGLGWGRTGGFGRTRTVVTGYTAVDNQLVAITETQDIGAGGAGSGLAYTATAAIEVGLQGPLGVFAETGALGLHLARDDVLVAPVRAGLVLR